MVTKPLDIGEAMTHEDLAALVIIADLVSHPDARFLEVGSWKGASSSVLAGRAKACGGKVFCVDHWKGNIGTMNVAIARDTDIYAIFEHNLKSMGLWEWVVPVRMDSLEACKGFPDGSFDMVFLDSDHRYVPFKHDVLAWWPKVKAGGVMCGHDCEGKYSDYDVSLQAIIDANLADDFIRYEKSHMAPFASRFMGGIALNGVHPGVVKALDELWRGQFAIVKETTIWVKRKEA